MTKPLDRIEAALARLGDEHEPPPGWEARVLAAVAPKRRRPWWMYAAPGLTLAAATVFLVWVFVVPPPAPPPAPGRLALDVRFTSRTRDRGAQSDERSLGDVVHIQVSGGNRHRVIRMYREEVHLVIGCPEDRACRVSSDATTVDVPLTQVGAYVIVVLTTASPLPALPGNLDADIAAATRAGISDVQQHKLKVP